MEELRGEAALEIQPFTEQAFTAPSMAAKEHIVMLPFMAQGHLIPFLALARKIRQRTGFTITIANTPLNIRCLRSSISESSPCDANIHLAELPFSPAEHGLPSGAENTDSTTFDQIMKLLIASPTLKSPLHKLVEEITEKDGKPPLSIIFDVLLGWVADVAKSFKIPSFTFTTGGAYGMAAYVSVWLNLPHRSTDSDEFTLPEFPQSCRFHVSQINRLVRSADGTDTLSEFLRPMLRAGLSSCGWLCNSVEEIEPLGLEVLRNLVKKSVWCVGPLFPPQVLNNVSLSTQRSGKQLGISTEKCVEWLNSHKPSSVLYISFGSQNTINLSLMRKLAIGLEDSKKPFIWVIKPPLGFDIKGEFRAEWLPEGFKERVRERKQGLLVKNWAPQLEILSHKSTRAFLSHCGWNSVLESLSQGVPIIGWPLLAEQAYNSKMMMEEMGVSVELTRGVETDIDADEVKRVIEMVMDDKGKGGDMKKKASQIGKLIRGAVEDGQEEEKIGSSVRALDHFMKTAIAKRNDLCKFEELSNGNSM